MLKNRSYEWYHNLNDNVKADWTELKSAFDRKYGPTAKPFVEQSILLYRKQMEKETVRAYAEEMERRFGLAGISEDESRKIFINGLKTALKPNVLSKCPATWSEAEKLAIEESTFILYKKRRFEKHLKK